MESSTTQTVAREYDLFQESLERLQKERKYLNYGYTVDRSATYEDRQERLCREVFESVQPEPDDVIVDVGFGSAEQDFLLLATHPFAELHGFNISERQVSYAKERARTTPGGQKLHFHLGEAEVLPGLATGSADKMMAIECAFYFDRPRFYRRAAEVLKPGGRLVVADIAFADRAAFLLRGTERRQRVGSRGINRSEWERYFDTVSLTDISRYTRPGAQKSVNMILKTVASGALGREERKVWMSLAYSSQLVVIALALRLVHYDLIVLERRADLPVSS